ncbi:hypothetical protein, partial [Moraxella catarrhalis]|uniref:hypothetical protein n=1 Tax=Moraxella catarrhalis TaxID=480 RepID=UPI001D0DBAAA
HKELPVARAVLANLRFAKLEDGKSVAVQGTRPFVEECVPNAEYGFDGQYTDKERHEPGSAGEGDSGLTVKLGVWVGVRASATVDEICVVDRGPNLWEVIFDKHHEDVDLGICETAGMGAWEVVLCN